jgi:hypothetical protein
MLTTIDPYLLDPEGSNGLRSLYFSNSSTEIMFHVITLMPTVRGDLQQIDKKRHVGNDYVHVIWSDNERDYVPNVITSHFNDIQIVVYPLGRAQEGLVRVQIFTKGEVEGLGPLQDGMVVSRGDLGRLVRQTAVIGHRRWPWPIGYVGAGLRYMRIHIRRGGRC